MGLKKIQQLYIRRGTNWSEKQKATMYTQTAAGLKPWISQWLVAAGVKILEPSRQRYTVSADLWNTSIAIPNTTNKYSNGAFSLPGATDNLIAYLPIGVHPNTPRLFNELTPLFGGTIPDQLNSLKIYDTAGVAHEIPGDLWTTAVYETVEIINTYVDAGTLVFTVPVSELAARMGISLAFPARVEAEVTCQIHYVGLIDFDASVSVYPLGVSTPYSNVIAVSDSFSRIEDPNKYYPNVEDGTYVVSGNIDGVLNRPAGRRMVAIIQPAFNGGWEIVKVFNHSTSPKEIKYTEYAAEGPESISSYKANGYGSKLTFLDPAAVAASLGPNQKLAVLCVRNQFPHGEYFNYVPPVVEEGSGEYPVPTSFDPVTLAFDCSYDYDESTAGPDYAPPGLTGPVLDSMYTGLLSNIPDNLTTEGAPLYGTPPDLSVSKLVAHDKDGNPATFTKDDQGTAFSLGAMGEVDTKYPHVGTPYLESLPNPMRREITLCGPSHYVGVLSFTADDYKDVYMLSPVLGCGNIFPVQPAASLAAFNGNVNKKWYASGLDGEIYVSVGRPSSSVEGNPLLEIRALTYGVDYELVYDSNNLAFADIDFGTDKYSCYKPKIRFLDSTNLASSLAADDRIVVLYRPQGFVLDYRHIVS